MVEKKIENQPEVRLLFRRLPPIKSTVTVICSREFEHQMECCGREFEQRVFEEERECLNRSVSEKEREFLEKMNRERRESSGERGFA